MTDRAEAAGWVSPELLDALEEGVLVLAGERVGGANAALRRMLGVEQGELPGTPLSELLADADGAALPAAKAARAQRLRHCSGELLPVTVRRVNEGLLVVVDRSRERRLEQEVWRLAGRRGEAVGEEPGPLTSEVAAMVEHEIQTAATVLRGYLRLLLEERAGPLAPDHKSYLRKARKETDRIGTLAVDLIELAAEQGAGALRIRRKPEPLRPLLERCVEAARERFSEREMELRFEPELEVAAVSVDAGRIEQLLGNLLQNAAKYGPSGSAVTLAADEIALGGERSLCVSVIDEGPGVSAAELEQIFQPFVRGAAGSSGARGVGLGLAVCQAIATAHGGKVEALPDLGHGHFRWILPLEV